MWKVWIGSKQSKCQFVPGYRGIEAEKEFDCRVKEGKHRVSWKIKAAAELIWGCSIW